MSRDDKLIHKFLEDKANITIEDCDRLLTIFGYMLRKDSGSHRTYHKKGDRPITIVFPEKSRYINSVYVNHLIKILQLEA